LKAVTVLIVIYLTTSFILTLQLQNPVVCDRTVTLNAVQCRVVSALLILWGTYK